MCNSNGAQGYILDLVEYNTAGLVDSEETNDRAEDRRAEHDLVVGNRKEENVIVVNTLGGIVVRFPCLGPGFHMILVGQGRRWPRRLRLRANCARHGVKSIKIRGWRVALVIEEEAALCLLKSISRTIQVARVDMRRGKDAGNGLRKRSSRSEGY